MKALTCEMCGSTNLVKEGGVFICQSCGTKYSVEEAKKMMVEGTVDVKGTVKIDKSDEIQNALNLAEAAYNGGNYEECYIFANKALESDSKNALAWMKKLEAVDNMGTVANLLRLDEFREAGMKTIENAKENEALKKEVYSLFALKSRVVMEFCNTNIWDVSDIKEYYNSFKDIGDAMVNSYERDTPFCNSIDLIAKKSVDLKNCIPSDFINSDPEYVNMVVDMAKLWVSYSDGFNKRLNIYGQHLADSAVVARKQILELIKRGVPEEKFALIDVNRINNNKDGCYVATAVYGSYDCPEVWTLRRFRDYTLDETWYGRLFIKVYYAISPTFVKHFGNVELFRSQGKKLFDKWVVKLNSKGYDSTPYKDKY